MTDKKIHIKVEDQSKDKLELNPSGFAKRRTMRNVSGAGAAALTGFIATGWIKPIVKSVVLPAHAQSSPPLTTCPTSFTIPGDSFDCSSLDVNIQTRYWVDDTDPLACATLDSCSILGAGCGVTAPSASFLIQRGVQVGTGSLQLVFLDGGNNFVRGATYTGCPGAPIGTSTPGAFDILHTSLNGVNYRVTGTTTQAPAGTATLSDVLVTPV